MISKLKLKDAKRLLKSKVYVLVTEDETSVHGEVQRDMDKVMQLTVLQEAKSQIDKAIKEVRKRNSKSSKK